MDFFIDMKYNWDNSIAECKESRRNEFGEAGKMFIITTLLFCLFTFNKNKH